MKALTLWQPWASLMALGVKWIETRSWSTSYRGWLAIHAAARPPRERVILGDWEAWPADKRGHEHPNHPTGRPARLYSNAGNAWDHASWEGLPLGAIVAAGRLVDVLPITDRWPDVHLLARGLRREKRREGSRSMFLRRHELLGGDSDGLCFVSSDADRGYTDGWANDQIPFGDFTPGRFAWIFEDLVRVEQRCPWCRGDGLEPADSAGYYSAAPDCDVCHGEKACAPVEARGRQQLWTWTPLEPQPA